MYDIRYCVGSSGNGLSARLAVPDTDGMALDGDLSAEGAGVLGVLRDLHLLDLFSEGGTVSICLRTSLVKGLPRIRQSCSSLRIHRLAIPNCIVRW